MYTSTIMSEVADAETCWATRYATLVCMYTIPCDFITVGEHVKCYGTRFEIKRLVSIFVYIYTKLGGCMRRVNRVKGWWTRTDDSRLASTIVTTNTMHVLNCLYHDRVNRKTVDIVLTKTSRCSCTHTFTTVIKRKKKWGVRKCRICSRAQ